MQRRDRLEVIIASMTKNLEDQLESFQNDMIRNQIIVLIITIILKRKTWQVINEVTPCKSNKSVLNELPNRSKHSSNQPFNAN